MLSVCDLLSVSFAAVCVSACFRDTQLLIRGDACCISAVISDYNIQPIKRSHASIILIFWEESNLHMQFQRSDAFTSVQFHLKCGPDHLLKWFEQSDLNASRKRFRGHLHLVFSRSDSYPIRENA